MARWSHLLPSGKGRSFLFFAVLVFLLLALCAAFPAATVLAEPATADPAAGPAVQADADWGAMPLYFTANQGQTDDSVAFYVSGRDKILYFTPQGLTIALSQEPSAGDSSAERWTVKLDYLGTDGVVPQAQDKAGAAVSYFTGSPEEWNAGVPTYSSIVYPDVWRGIDVAYSGNQDQLKQEFVLSPGADPSAIRLAYRGADVSLDDEGALVVSTPAGDFSDAAPTAFQEVDGRRVDVSVEFVLGDTTGAGADAVTDYGFCLGDYDQTLPVVIDPALLIYCGYLGGGYQERGFGIAVDGDGCAYVTGETWSTQATFPVAVGPDLTFNGAAGDDTDAFVAKVKADGTGLVYCGYIGGSSYDTGYGIAVDSGGNAYVTGETQSSEATFPVTVGPDLVWSGGSHHGFVAKVNATGTALSYCGYLHDDTDGRGSGVAVDSSGCAYVAGSGFVDKITADGTGLEYSYDLGGEAIAVDSSGCAYVTGGTMATEATFPVTVGPDLTYNDNVAGTGTLGDAYVAKLNAAGTDLAYCGYIGGAHYEEGYGIAVDASGCAYVTGITCSGQDTFPVAVGPDLTYNDIDSGIGYAGDGFVAKVEADGTGLVYCGYIGDAYTESGQGVAVDAAGDAFVAGYIFHGEDAPMEAFMTKVVPDGSDMSWDAVLDGSSGSAVAVDAGGSVYLTGDTGHLPAVVGPDLTYNGGGDAFVAKIAYVSRYQQSDFHITYLGYWSTAGTWSASGGSFASTEQPGAAAIVKFEGTKVTVIGRTTAWYGEAEIYVDGALKDTVDLYSPYVNWKVPIYSDETLSDTEHTLIVKCNGTKNPSSAGHAIGLDAIDLNEGDDLLLAPSLTRYQDSDADLDYQGDWGHTTGNWAFSNGDYSGVSDVASVSAEFDGRYLAWYGCVSQWYGKARVVLDEGTPGEQITMVDLWKPYEATKQLVYNTGLLEDAHHTVDIYWTGDQNVSSWGTGIGADNFDVLGTLTSADAALPTEVRYQANDYRMTYLGSWSKAATWSATGGGYAFTSQPGAAVVAKFTGTSVKVIAKRCPWYGKALIKVDGTHEQTVDLYSSNWSQDWRQTVYTQAGLSDSEHILTMECLGEANAGSASTTICLDALDITGYLEEAPTTTRIDDKDATHCTYDPAWSRWDGGPWLTSGNTYAYTDQAAYKMTFTFEGTFASWIACISNTKGKALVTLDGDTAHAMTVDLYDPDTMWKRPVYSTGLLGYGTHTVEIECLGVNDAASVWHTIDVDAFDVLPAIP